MKSWYDLVARIYDPFTRRTYRIAREAAVRALGLEGGETVLDLACGTGLNFPLIEAGIGPDGQVLGVDYSEGMLGRARIQAEREGWRNVTLVQADAAKLSSGQVADALGSEDARVDALLCTLGLSVIPGWEAALDGALALLRPGAVVSVMDGRSQSAGQRLLPRPMIRFVNLTASADITRDVEGALAGRLEGFSVQPFRLLAWPDVLFVGSGRKYS